MGQTPLQRQTPRRTIPEWNEIPRWVRVLIILSVVSVVVSLVATLAIVLDTIVFTNKLVGL